jgi:dual specificity protein kinase YAK1
MDQQQWGPSFTDANRQSRYTPQSVPSQQNVHRDHTLASAATMPMGASSAPPGRGLEYGDRDGDVSMEDADPYKPKQGSRTAHQRLPSNVQLDDSSAARRYSPMNLSPSSPFTATTQQSTYGGYTPQTSSRTSPTRASSYMSPSSSYYQSPPGQSFIITNEWI